MPSIKKYKVSKAFFSSSVWLYESKDWKLVDAIDIIIHIFHPEKRSFYDLETMWSENIPKEKAMI